MADLPASHGSRWGRGRRGGPSRGAHRAGRPRRTPTAAAHRAGGHGQAPQGRAALGLLVAAAAVAAVSGLLVSGVVGGSGHPAVAGPPPTAVDRHLVDHQPAPGPMSPLLPGASPEGASVTIPTLGVHATVLPEGIDRTPGDVGNLAIPPDPRQVGWWDGGPAPGQAGVAVLASHRAAGGAFWRLPDLRPGDTVQVTGTDGTTTSWEVSRVQQLRKSALPPSIWTEGGPPLLALVTCGGTFDPATGHYDDNVIAWASPAASPPARGAGSA